MDAAADAATAPSARAEAVTTEAVSPQRRKLSDLEPAPHHVHAARHPRFSPLDLLPGRWAFMVVLLLHVAAAAFAIVYFG